MYRARAIGRRMLGPAFDYVLLTRPRQWPILTAQFAVGVLAAPAIADRIISPQAAHPGAVAWVGLFVAWVAWVLCLNGGTLAFNSSFDRDAESIAYLDDPPQPPPGLAPASLAVMAAGIALAWTISAEFALIVGVCVVLSVLYSLPPVRLKSLPGCDLLTNMVGYGGGTTLAGLIVGQSAGGAAAGIPSPEGWYLAVGFALLFGSFHPLTQLYQIESDTRRGDRTLATALGVRRSLSLAILLGVAATYFLIGAAQFWNPPESMNALTPLVGAAVAWNVLLGAWRRRGTAMKPADHAKWMYRALLIWALVDAAVLAARFGRTWAGGGPA